MMFLCTCVCAWNRFPPLTNLVFDDTSEEVEEDGVTVVPVQPMWS